MRRTLRWLAVAGHTLLSASSAAAQPTAPGGDTPAIVAPRLKTESPASYPEQALRDHVADVVSVVVILDVDSSGNVRAARPETPHGHGFDEAASEAAAKLVFEPASRAGVPVAARIKYQYVFQPPSPRLVGRAFDQSTDQPIHEATVVVRDAKGEERTLDVAPDGTWSVDGLRPGAVHLTIAAPGFVALQIDEEVRSGEETSVVLRLAPVRAAVTPTVAGGPVASDQPEDVLVRGERAPRETTKRTLTKEEIAHVPGTNGDALRSVQSLPGVARPPPFSGQLVVRGSAPQDTTIFVDGVDVPLIYHFGGLSSVIPTELLEKIDFYPANYSSVYGRGMGGMVEVGLRSPKSDSLHGMAQVDFIDARVLAEGPIGQTGFKFLVGARRSYFDLWLGPVLKGAAGAVTTAPRYYDYQALLEKDIDARSSFRLAIFGADDALEILNQSPNASSPTFGGNVGAHTSFWRAHARYENRFTDRTQLRVTAAVGHDSIDFGIGPNFFTVYETTVNSRIEVTQKIARGVKANVGTDVVVAPYEIALRLPP